MEVKVVFTSEIYLKGDNIGEIKEKFEGLPIFSADAIDNYAEVCDVVSVEDTNDHKDLLNEYSEA